MKNNPLDHGHKGDILVVDDNLNNLKTIEAILTEEGYRVRCVPDGNSAITVAVNQPPDLMILDVRMPQMDGYEVCRHLKKKDETKGFPVLFLSAASQTEDKVRGFEAGGVDYISKPVETMELLARVKLHRRIFKLQESLRQSEARFRCLSDASFEGIIITSKGMVIEANETFGTMFGYHPSELINREVFDLVAPEERENVRAKIMSGDEQPYETCGLTKNGSAFPVEVHAKMLSYKGEQVRVTAVRDISERKKLEKELIKSKKLEATAILAGGIAHDFNNLLSVIIGFVDMALDDLGMDHRNAEDLKSALQAGQQAQELTNRFITFSAGGTPVKKKSSIQELIAESVHGVLPGRDYPVNLSLADDLWSVKMDTGQISRVFSNILRNAMEAMEGGGTLQVRAENIASLSNENIVEQGVADRKFVKITISDQGTGIPEKIMQNIFDPYFSIKERGAQKGMGLGLTVAHSIVQQHNGHLVVNSKEGVGTSAHIYLPASA